MRAMPTAAIDAALDALRAGAGGDAALLRAATRAADDAEVAALEASGAAERAATLRAVRIAREEIAAARAALRESAAQRRDELLKRDTSDVGDTQAAAVARDINDSLRRSTGVVSNEVERSNAAAHVR